jgi:LPXTG-motif cell wall-anchored protein
LRVKLYLNLIVAFSLILFLFHPLTSAAAEQKTFTDQNNKKQTQIHLHVNKCARDFAHVYVKVNGEWEEMSNPGNSPLYKLPDKGEYVKDDITEFSFVTAENEEFIIPVSDLKVGVEANGTINYWLEKCSEPKPEVEKQTEIHFDLKEFAKQYTKVFIKINGEWVELTLKENTTLYTLIVKNKLDINVITEIKCITLQNEEIVIPISKLKLDWKTDGFIKIWLEQSPLPVDTEQGQKQTQIHLHLQKCVKDFKKVFVKLDGKWRELTRQGNSPLFKMLDKGEYVKDDITEFRFVTSSNQEIIIPVSGLKVGVEAEGTINYWLQECPKSDVPVDSNPTPPADKPDDGEKGTVGGNGDSDGAVGSDNGTGGSEGTSGNDNGVETPTGELPQTGESSHAFYYLAGLIFIAIGTFILKFRLKKSF